MRRGKGKKEQQQQKKQRLDHIKTSVFYTTGMQLVARRIYLSYPPLWQTLMSPELYI